MKRYKTIKQLAEDAPFSEPAIRWYVFNASTNGLSSSLIRIGRRILIDVDDFYKWIESHREQQNIGKIRVIKR